MDNITRLRQYNQSMNADCRKYRVFW